MSFISPVTNVLYTAVSWVLLRWHQFFSLFMDPKGGATWALSIVFLVITARLLLVKFFIKQVHYTRHMQKLQPEIAKIKEKHKGDRQAQTQAMQKLQSDQGFNPLAGCLPMLLQFPIFISLFHVLRHLSRSVHSTSHRQLTLYGFSENETISAARARLFGHAPLAGTLHDSAHKLSLLGGEVGTVRLVAIVLAIISAAATYITQQQSMRNATTVATGQAATVQRLMLYFIPLSVLGSGLFFPIGVLLYWFTSNLWTMGQQFYIYRFHPVTELSPIESVVTEATHSRAPAPGAKPVRPQNRRPGSTATAVNMDKPAGGASELSSSTVARSTPPRPGARPGGNRPKNNRAGQRSKRR